jgi:hypothetical protein
MEAVQGTPPAALFPAKNYVMELQGQQHMIKVPRKGKYSDLDPDFFGDNAGEFRVTRADGMAIDMNMLSRILFATKQYPDLGFDQFFVINTIAVKGEDVIVVGQVIRALAPVKEGQSEG